MTREFTHQVQLSTNPLPPDAFLSGTISAHISSSPTPLGGIENLVQALLRESTGDWFYAGWIDQAVLHVGSCRTGGAELLSSMLRQIDDDPVDQSGDMLVGFVRQDRDWFLAIEASPDDSSFTVVLYTDSDHDADLARIVAGLEEGA